MKALILVLILSISILLSFESMATNYTSRVDGPWTTPTTWTPTAPSGGPIDGDVVTIQHTVTRPTFSDTWWGGSITIQNNGRLQYTGNATLTGSGNTFNVQSGGRLEVTGSLILNNQSKIVVSSGGTVTVGINMIMDGGSTNSGTVNIGGDVTLNNSGGTFSNAGTMTIGGTLTPNASFGNSGNLTTVNLTTLNTGGTFTNTGTVTVTMTASIAGTVQLSPGSTTSSRMTVYGNLTLSGSGLTVGNGTPGTPAKYADLVIAGNVSETSHTLTVNCNGRVAILGDLTLSNNGGVKMDIKYCSTVAGVPIGGQVYVDGDGVGNSVTVTSGSITNGNPTVGGAPYGYYVNGPVSGNSAAAGTVAQMELYNPTFATWVQSVMGPLPVTLQYLQCNSTDDGVILNWATATEENADYFQIERSADGLDFESIGRETATGDSKDLLKYEFKDDRPLEGKNYYRLKTVDFDGSYENSKIVSVNYEVPKNFNIYPNPYVGENIHFNTNFAPQEDDVIIVVNSMGVELTRIRATNKEIEIDYLNPGVYFFKYVSSNFQKTVRVVKAN